MKRIIALLFIILIFNYIAIGSVAEVPATNEPLTNTSHQIASATANEQESHTDDMSFGGDVEPKPPTEKEYSLPKKQNAEPLHAETASESELTESGSTQSRQESSGYWYFIGVSLLLYALYLLVKYTDMIGRWYIYVTTLLVMMLNILIVLFFGSHLGDYPMKDIIAYFTKTNLSGFYQIIIVVVILIAMRAVFATMYLHGYFIEYFCRRKINISLALRPIVYFAIIIFIEFLFSSKIRLERYPNFQSFLRDAILYKMHWPEFLMALTYYLFFVYQFVLVICYAVSLRFNFGKWIQYIVVITASCCLYFSILVPLILESFFFIVFAGMVYLLIMGAGTSSKWDSESVHSHDIYSADSAGNKTKIGTGYTHRSRMSGSNSPNRPDKEYYD